MASIPTGYRSLAGLRKNAAFLAAMKSESNGAAVWASWRPNAIRGSLNLRLNMTALKAEANGAGVYARWPPGQNPRTRATIQVDAAALIAAFS